jgi:hypothetical protein
MTIARLLCSERRSVVTERFLVLVRHFHRRLVDVNSRRCGRGMAEYRLNGRLSYPPANEFGRQSVPEGVRRDRVLYPGRSPEISNDLLHPARADSVTRLTDSIAAAERGIVTH